MKKKEKNQQLFASCVSTTTNVGPISRGRHITLSFCIFLIASLRICELCVCVSVRMARARERVNIQSSAVIFILFKKK